MCAFCYRWFGSRNDESNQASARSIAIINLRTAYRNSIRRRPNVPRIETIVDEIIRSPQQEHPYSLPTDLENPPPYEESVEPPSYEESVAQSSYEESIEQPSCGESIEPPSYEESFEAEE
ncbi:hypothetical protein CEXT_768061 [Caerostris extrusa]|uniref:Uncharacterized protein n=1 Tax=Caerostris extrusa TaxID=172846 RepID=A0AAV4V156_CAEEX|nr:hypothetical protein CEXT_768061 [Caerostris extrusa]